MPKDLHRRCALAEDSNSSFLPPLSRSAGYLERLQRALKKSTLISDRHPKCGQYYRSETEVLSIRKKQVESHSNIIHPFSMFRVYYEMWMAIVFTLCQVYMPLDAAFDTHDAIFGEDPHFKYIFYIMDLILSAICLFDIVVNFMTGDANDNLKSVEMNPGKIAREYIGSRYFICDVLSSIPDMYHILENMNAVRIINALKVLKIMRLSTTFHYFSRTADYFQISSMAYKIVRLTFFSFLVFHYAACFMFLQPQLRLMLHYPTDPYAFVYTWGISKASVTTKYIRCLYIASAIVLGVRTGGKNSVPWDELLFVALMYVLGKLFTLLLTVVISQMLLRARALETKYQDIMSEVEGFMIRQRLDSSLQARLVENYRYKYNNLFFNEYKILDQLSEHIKNEVKAEILSTLVNRVQIFELLTRQELTTIISLLKCEIYFPRDIIIKYGIAADCMYFICSGTVLVSSPSGKEICHLQDGDYFGEICMIFKDKRRTANVIALETCEVYKIHKKGFNTCFKNNKDVWRVLKEMATERMQMADIYEEIHLRTLMGRKGKSATK